VTLITFAAQRKGAPTPTRLEGVLAFAGTRTLSAQDPNAVNLPPPLCCAVRSGAQSCDGLEVRPRHEDDSTRTEIGQPSMFDYYSVIASAVSRLPSNNDEVRHAIYEQARTALHERLGNDPQISDDELVNEHYMLEAAIYKVEEGLLLSVMRRFVREETALSPPSLIISKIKEFVRSVGDKFVRLGVF
jgi:hypothetical protein